MATAATTTCFHRVRTRTLAWMERIWVRIWMHSPTHSPAWNKSGERSRQVRRLPEPPARVQPLHSLVCRDGRIELGSLPLPDRLRAAGDYVRRRCHGIREPD